MTKGWSKGLHHSEEHRRKIGEANRRRIVSEETKKKISESRKKLFATSQAAHENLSRAMTGKPSPREGVVLSEEIKQKISQNRKGKALGNQNAKTREDYTEREMQALKSRMAGNCIRKGATQNEEARVKIAAARTGTTASEETKLKMSVCRTGPLNPNWNGGDKEYCEKWTPDLRRRIRAFWGDACGACGAVQAKPLLSCHHVYYNKKACCVVAENGKYYSNLNLLNHPFDFEIVGDPNKFIPLCKKCHDKTTALKNRVMFAREFERKINETYNGKSYLTTEEYVAKILGR